MDRASFPAFGERTEHERGKLTRDFAKHLRDQIRAVDDPLGAAPHVDSDFYFVDVGSGVRVKKHRKTHEVWMTGPGDGGTWYRIKSTGREGVVFEALIRTAPLPWKTAEVQRLRERCLELEAQIARRAVADIALEDE